MRIHTFISSAILLVILFVSSQLQASDVFEVDVYQATQTQINSSLSLTGTVEAKQHANLATLQPGVVAELFVEVGDKVKKGQKLLSLDAKLANLAVEQAKAVQVAITAQKDEAVRLYEEVISLSKQQLVAETLLGERLSGVQIANAELGRANAELARQQEVLARHTLYAPFAGVIARRQIDVGEWVTQQTPVFTLVEQKGLRLRVAIPQEYFVQLSGSKNINVMVTPDFANASTYSGVLDRLVGVATNTSRTVTGLVNLPENISLVAGMSAKAEILLPASQSDLVWLPKSAIKQHPDGGRSVFKVDDNKAKRVLVKVVKTQGDLIAVTGTQADKPFVITGVELLRDGDSVKVNQVTGDGL